MPAHRLRAATAFVLVTLAAVPVGYLALFSSFSPSDDEGYVLLTLKSYAAGARLYDQLYSQYGPVFYSVVTSLFGTLGLPYTHTAGRFVTLGVWLGASLLCGVASFRMTGRVTLGVAVQLLVFDRLSALCNEPIHPGGLLCLGLSAMLAVVASGRASGGVMALLGAGIGAMLFTKVNVGTFALISLALVLAFTLLDDRPSARLAKLLVAVIAITCPLVLMTGRFASPMVQRYAIQVSFAVLGLVVTLACASRRPALTPSEAACALPGLLAVTGLACAAMLVRGTSPAALLRGVLLDPLRFPGVAWVPLDLPVATTRWGVAALAAAAAYHLLSRTGRAASALLTVIRLAGGVIMSVASSGAHAFEYAVPFVWIAAVESPGTTASDPKRLARWLVPSLAAMQALVAYPVAGSQKAWGSFLLIPCGAICIADALDDCVRWAGTRLRRPRHASVMASWIAVACVGWVLYAVTYPSAAFFSERYRRSIPIGLPGAEQVRASAEVVATSHWLAARIRERCPTFITMPGLNSLYIFTEQAPPTMLNASPWVTVFDDTTQERVVEQVRALGQLCVIRNELLVGFWRGAGPHRVGPLERYIDENFRTVESRDGYDVMIRADGSRQSRLVGQDGAVVG